jgi:hypothetical protein
VEGGNQERNFIPNYPRDWVQRFLLKTCSFIYLWKLQYFLHFPSLGDGWLLTLDGGKDIIIGLLCPSQSEPDYK